MMFNSGPLKKLYVDRDDVKARQGAAKPWVVEVHRSHYIAPLKFRGTGVIVLFSQGMFDIAQQPCIWLETYESVELTDGEVYV